MAHTTTKKITEKRCEEMNNSLIEFIVDGTYFKFSGKDR